MNDFTFTRRHFIKTAALSSAAVSVPNILSAQTGGAVPGGKVKVGVIGCGGRSGGDVNNVRTACQLLGLEVEFVAVADVFQDRLDECRTSLQEDRGVEVPDERCFVGFDAYERLIDTDVDIVLLATPPYFRPQHFEACRNDFLPDAVAWNSGEFVRLHNRGSLCWKLNVGRGRNGGRHCRRIDNRRRRLRRCSGVESCGDAHADPVSRAG